MRLFGYRGPVVSVPAGATETITSSLWTGPKLQNKMAEVANHLDLTVDYGWAWFIAKPLFWLLTFIQSIVSNWGVAIICVTLVVKAILYPLTKAQYTSMAKMRMLQPKMQEMRERFGDDRQRMSQEMMKLYKEEKVNPLGGCLPLILQMPIFIALYWTFMEAVELSSCAILWLDSRFIGTRPLLHSSNLNGRINVLVTKKCHLHQLPIQCNKK